MATRVLGFSTISLHHPPYPYILDGQPCVTLTSCLTPCWPAPSPHQSWYTLVKRGHNITISSSGNCTFPAQLWTSPTIACLLTSLLKWQTFLRFCKFLFLWIKFKYFDFSFVTFLCQSRTFACGRWCRKSQYGAPAPLSDHLNWTRPILPKSAPVDMREATPRW